MFLLLFPLISATFALEAGPTLALPEPAIQVVGGYEAPTSAWEAPARLAGFTLVDPGTPADVVCTILGQEWELRVRDGSGGLRSARVAAPQTTADREDVALLAASLLRSVRVSGVGGSEPTAERPRISPPVRVNAQVVEPSPSPIVTPSRTSAPVEAPPVEVPPVEVSPFDEASGPTEATSLETPLPPDETHHRPINPWSALGPGLEGRAGLSWAPAMDLAGGVALDDWDLGLSVRLLPARDVEIHDAGRLRSWEFRGKAGWTPDLGFLTPRFSGLLGTSFRAWDEQGATIATQRAWVAGVEAGVAARVTDGARIVPWVRIERDLGETLLGETARIRLSPW